MGTIWAFEGRTSSSARSCRGRVDYHPLSIPVPHNHANVDSDEVLFYCGGNYEARKGSGIDELAVMVDTFRPLALALAGLACEDPGYAWTWSGRHTGG
jgi:homogentisate 1,2-dioxygenase